MPAYSVSMAKHRLPLQVAPHLASSIQLFLFVPICLRDRGHLSPAPEQLHVEPSTQQAQRAMALMLLHCRLTTLQLEGYETGRGALVAAPCAKRGCLKSCAVPQRTFLPVSFCRCSASSTTFSSAALLSARLPSSGAMSLQ